MVVGAHLIARAPVMCFRPDVQDHLGVLGSFGFALDIPSDFPLIDFEDAPSVIALHPSGSPHADLTLLVGAETTTPLLQMSFSSQFRGLRGHFDGFSACDSVLLGWCYQSRQGSDAVTVYVHGLFTAPVPLVCNQPRPDLESQGFSSSNCGFVMTLDKSSSALQLPKREVWVSFDEAGLLRLPQDQRCILP